MLMLILTYLSKEPCKDGFIIGGCTLADVVFVAIFSSFAITYIAITSVFRLIMLKKHLFKNQLIKQIITIYLGGFLLSLPASIGISIATLPIAFHIYSVMYE